MSIFIFGHKNPDTDSVASAIAFSNLKNSLGYNTTPCILGDISRETAYVLDYFNTAQPRFLDNVKAQVKDLKYSFDKSVSEDSSILSIYQLMEQEALQTIAVVDDNNKLKGIISMKDIAMGLIKGDFYHLKTSIDNLLKDLNGKILAKSRDNFDGKISVIAYYYKSISNILGPNDIIIVGDRYDVIEEAIQARVQLIIITGNKDIPEKYVDMAKDNSITMVSVPWDTYYTSKIINQSNLVSTIMRSSNIIRFYEDEYLDEINEEIINTNYRNYPVVDGQGKFLGFINKKHILNPERKKVILVDHNEYAQSVDGLKEAEILEIVDHHKLGDISTSMPINFRNSIVGSTCTIIYQMFREYKIDIEYKIAGLLISGILSDTLYFKSPTTTDIDRDAVAGLNEILKLDLDKYVMDMFKTGTSLEGQSIKEIFYNDFKEFNLESYKTGVSQVFTLDIEDVFNRKELFLDFIEATHRENNNHITILLITDILKEGSYILYQSDNGHIVSSAFSVDDEQGVFIKDIISRKKQVIPKLSEAIRLINNI